MEWVWFHAHADQEGSNPCKDESIKGRFIKIKYVAQLPAATPMFAFFCNHPQYIREAYRRFLELEPASEFAKVLVRSANSASTVFGSTGFTKWKSNPASFVRRYAASRRRAASAVGVAEVTPSSPPSSCMCRTFARRS